MLVGYILVHTITSESDEAIIELVFVPLLVIVGDTTGSLAILMHVTSFGEYPCLLQPLSLQEKRCSCDFRRTINLRI